MLFLGTTLFTTCGVLEVTWWWSTLNTEIKDLLLRIQSYQRLFLQCRSSSEYSFMCFTYCQKFSISHFCLTSSFRFISTESSLKNACPWSEQVDWYHCFFKCSNSESDQTCDFMNCVWVVLELHMLPVISKHKASWKKNLKQEWLLVFWNILPNTGHSSAKKKKKKISGLALHLIFHCFSCLIVV